MHYVHILLFACPGCNFPVLANFVTEEENLSDPEPFKMDCTYCGLSSGATAMAAKKHFVEEWPE
jgi:hypothetical protein